VEKKACMDIIIPSNLPNKKKDKKYTFQTLADSSVPDIYN
jgi:hypothetical protein